MIRTIKDDLWSEGDSNGESDADRIARWVNNAREEIAGTTDLEADQIASVVSNMRDHPDLYQWGERRLTGMGCHWLLMIVEPDRSAVVADRMAQMGVTP